MPGTMRRRLGTPPMRALWMMGVIALTGAGAQRAWSQGARPQDAALIEKREATEKELESVAIIERKVMVPMRDGKRMQADIYRPKDSRRSIPSSFRAPLTTSTTGTCGWARLGT